MSNSSSKLSTSFSSQSPSESSSTSITETINGSHLLKITGYSLTKGMGIGKYITSDTFTVGGYDFGIYFYPEGHDVEDNARYVSLFIMLASEGRDVRALFEVTLFDQSGKEMHWVDNHFGRAVQDGPFTFKYRGCMCVWVVRSHTEGPKSHTILEPPSNIAQHFGQLLESGEGSDITFEVDGEIFAAHKLVLGARSPVFRAQLFNQMEYRDMQCIKVEDMQPAVFKALLHFIYWDCLPKMPLSGVDLTNMAQHLLAGADRYALERLRLVCEAMLSHDVCINTVGRILALAEQYHCLQLKYACLFLYLVKAIRAKEKQCEKR